MKRIEIHLTEKIANAIQKKAEAMNHSRKSYIEFLCMQDLKLSSFEKTDVREQKIIKKKIK